MNVAIFFNDIFHAIFVVLVKTKTKKREKNTHNCSTPTQSFQCLWIAVHTMNQNKSQLSSYCMFTFWAIGLSYSLQQFTILQVNFCAFNTMIFQSNLLVTDCTTYVYGLNEKRMMINQVERNGIYSRLRPINVLTWKKKQTVSIVLDERIMFPIRIYLWLTVIPNEKKISGIFPLLLRSHFLRQVFAKVAGKTISFSLLIPFFPIYFESNNCLAEINFDVIRFVWSVLPSNAILMWQ